MDITMQHNTDQPIKNTASSFYLWHCTWCTLVQASLH